MSILNQAWFSTIRRPSRYIGNEFNAEKKDPADIEVSVALAFPDVYEVGMSHLGLKILYHLFNIHPWLSAERVFSPWIDLEKQLKQRGIHICTLETGRPLIDFDIIGFSLQHELCYTNVLTILDLSGIPLLAAERREKDPLVIAGGPACFNPEPVADFFDAIVIGDGEEAATRICRAVREQKRGHIRDREELLDHLRRIPGVYIPGFFHIHYGPDGAVAAIEPKLPDYPFVSKAIIPDIDEYPYPLKQVVPFTELVHDRLALEISRGCTRGCRFCQAGMIYRPVRERSPASILEKARTALKLTGYEDLSLLSLSTGDYSSIENLIQALMDKQAREKVAISLPSLRINSLSPQMIEQIKRVRKTGFTLAVEAGTERLRKIINKGLTQEDILEMARMVYTSGWNLIKLYFMVGLPFEETEDILDIIGLAKRVAECAGRRGGKNRLNISLSTFVPKSHTPFMWVRQISIEESRKRIQMIRDGLRDTRIHVKWNSPELSWLEGILSRGDRKLSRAIAEAWKLGARFDAWGEQFRMSVWENALRHCGLDARDYLHRERDPGDVLPWDHIHSGVTGDFLKNEWERAKKSRPTPDCRKKCLECGVCDHDAVDPVLFGDSIIQPITEAPVSTPSAAVSPQRYRLTFEKRAHAKYLSHLELTRLFIRAFRRAGLSLAYSAGFHPMPRLSYVCALPVGTESLQETLDFDLVEADNPMDVKQKISHQLPSGVNIVSVHKIRRGKKAKLKESSFVVTLKGAVLNKQHLDGFMQSDHFPLIKKTKKGEHEIDARNLVKSIRMISKNQLMLVIRHSEGPNLKPEEIVRGIFPPDELRDTTITILKTKQILS